MNIQVSLDEYIEKSLDDRQSLESYDFKTAKRYGPSYRSVPKNVIFFLFNFRN